jgi:MerR family transcriptional regulator, light-induced transcriptional regulator
MPYRIKTVAELTGIPKNTLVAWERRYGLVDPDRMENGYRVYTDDDVDLIRRIKAKVDEGYKISEAVALVRIVQQAHHTPVSTMSAGDVWDVLARDLSLALISGNRSEAERVYSRTLLSPMDEVVSKVLLPCVRLVGDAWHRGEISVAQEHLATSWVREHLGSMLQRVLGGRNHKQHAVCATLSGERHELGVLALGVHLGLRGWRVSVIGADVPEGALAEMAGNLEADVLCISMVSGAQGDRSREQLSQLRALLPKKVQLVVGGPMADPQAASQLPNTRFYPTMTEFLDAL